MPRDFKSRWMPPMIKCLIVDDEPIAVRTLRSHLEALEDVEIVATCSDAFEARRVLRQEEIDLVLLDIEMPQLTGVGLIQALDRPPRFIFTTAYRDYAIQGFDLDAVDYLLKPISLPRLLRAIDKYRRLVSSTSAAPASEERSILLRVERRTVKLSLSEIRFVESMGDYVKVHTHTGAYMSKLPISELEAGLAGGEFVRIHRSFIVSLSQVDAFTAKTVELSGRTLPIGRTYQESVLEKLRR